MRSVVCCDVINSLASAIHNGRPQRYAVLPRLEILARCFAIYLFFPLSIYLSPICLPICLCSPSKFRYSSHTNANSLTHSMRVSICTSARNQHFFLFLSLWLPASHYFTVSSPYNGPLPSSHILFGWPVKVSK